MGNKPFVEDDKMNDVYVKEARVMGEFLLRREYRGIGDTIEAAAHRVQTKFGAPASILLRLRHRREMKDMMLSSFAAIAEAYQKASSKTDQIYENERSIHAPNSKAVWLADLVSGTKTSERDQ
ncbi:hypothetical protein [Phyllobacterium calauticae]|jgi:hypothetical protein|uniref:hypothetical protein n=1 Tax=Phyllobacterium calauticae TaxID=2817027 RepID=UPI001CBB5F6E|nr:hypothetical protein [Phyllobacterium calauticae]MBZ3691012.1 hypothetical protein [Phyllobacterium calauticae]